MLADPEDDVLVLADGTKISKTKGSVVKDKKPSQFTVIPSPGEAQTIVARAKRSVAELPVPSGQMNALSLVLMYTMWGLNDLDTAITIGISAQQVKNIKATPEYKTLSDDILKSVMEFQSNDIRTYIQQKAFAAVEKVVETLDEDGVLGFKAAQDILDRAGHRPADIVEHKHSLSGGLRIEYVDRKPSAEVPAIDVSYRDITPSKE